MLNEDCLIENLQHYYESSADVADQYGGPSVYFHVQAIQEQESNFLSDRHLEMIYATLASWGMHRMGDPMITKTKMVKFRDFKDSILGQRRIFEEMLPLRMEDCTLQEYLGCLSRLEEVYLALRVSRSHATIVANSKAIAHILPNLVPPVDRQYTIRFFTQPDKQFFTRSGKYKAVTVPSEIPAQLDAFKHYSESIKVLLDRCDRQLFQIDTTTLNTSYPKIVDNMIIAFVKEVHRPEAQV